MKKFLFIFLLVTINSSYSMEKTIDYRGEFQGEFMYKDGPSYVLTNQSHSVPFYEPIGRDNRFDFGMHPEYQDSTLHDAVKNDEIQQVTELLNSDKYSANTLNGWGSTPLFYVKSVAMAYLLIHHRANVNAVAQCGGGTPLHSLVQRKDERGREIVNLLLAAGAEINALSWGFTTPLTMAKYGGKEMIELLKKHGA